MKKIMLVSLLLCSASLFAGEASDQSTESKKAEKKEFTFPKNGSDLFAGAIACGKDLEQCQRFKEHLLSLGWWSRKPILYKFGMPNLSLKTPNEEVQTQARSYLKTQPGLDTVECRFYEPFFSKKTYRCAAVKAAFTKAFASAKGIKDPKAQAEYFKDVKGWYQFYTKNTK